MSKTKASMLVLLFVSGILGLFWGISLQISFEPTSEAYTEAHLGKLVVAISIAILITAIVLVKRLKSNWPKN